MKFNNPLNSNNNPPLKDENICNPVRYEHPTVLPAATVEIGKSYVLGALPAGIIFRHAQKIYRTVSHPEYNITARNCQRMAQVWRRATRAMERIAYREEVKVIAKA